MSGHAARIAFVLAIGLVPLFSCADAPPTAPPKQTLADQLKAYSGMDRESNSTPTSKPLQIQLSHLTDSELKELYEGLGHPWLSLGPDFCLTEMIRRGGPYWEKTIQSWIDKEVSRDADSTTKPAEDRPKIIYDIRLLTALRRIQKKEDPLPVLVEGRSEIYFHVGYAPPITAILTNLDSEKAIIGLGTGGDYRGAGRHNRYRLQITDSDGKILPEREASDMGGFVGGEVLHSHESYPMPLEIAAYVDIDKPGTYTMVVQYHPEMSIAYLSSVDGLVYCESIPIKLTVAPFEIETIDADQAKVRDLISKLPDKGTVKVLGGSYVGKAAGEFLPKDSPAVQIQEMGWQAVPALITAVNDEKLNPTRRAWALGILYGVTNLNNPTRSPGVLGPFEYRSSGWLAANSNSDGLRSFSTSDESVLTGTIDINAQIQFAKLWKPWIDKGYIRVKKTAEKK